MKKKDYWMFSTTKPRRGSEVSGGKYKTGYICTDWKRGFATDANGKTSQGYLIAAKLKRKAANAGAKP